MIRFPDTAWMTGPPPSIGWWPASAGRNDDAFRWWDGSEWSCVAFSDEDAAAAALMASTPAEVDNIQWKQRPKSWPARSMT